MGELDAHVEAFDVGVLGRAAWLDEDVLDAVLLCPCHECRAGEFRSVVGSDFLGVTPERGSPVQQPGLWGAGH
jgi:hypothetical protein